MESEVEIDEIIDSLLCGQSIDSDLMDEHIDEIEEQIFICGECENWCFLDNLSFTNDDGEKICQQCQPKENVEDKGNAFD